MCADTYSVLYEANLYDVLASTVVSTGKVGRVLDYVIGLDTEDCGKSSCRGTADNVDLNQVMRITLVLGGIQERQPFIGAAYRDYIKKFRLYHKEPD